MGGTIAMLLLESNLSTIKMLLDKGLMRFLFFAYCTLLLQNTVSSLNLLTYLWSVLLLNLFMEVCDRHSDFPILISFNMAFIFRQFCSSR